tara:strand:- start:1797 stop:3779 length:1983 start_codon:yes stop_codon:yes gene_type:complete
MSRDAKKAMQSESGQGFLKKDQTAASESHRSKIENLLINQEWDTVKVELKKAGICEATEPKSSNLFYLKALQLCYYHLENHTSAKNIGIALLKKTPRDVNLIATTASSCRVLCDHERSISLWENALQILPGNNLLKYNYANSLRDAGRYQDAIAWYESSIENSNDENPTLISCFENFAALLSQERLYQAAIEYSEKGLRISKGHFKISCIAADAYIRLECADEALSILDKVDDSNLSDVDLASICRLKASAYHLSNQKEKALEMCRQGNALTSEDITEFDLLLSQIYSTSGDKERAIQALKNACNKDSLLCEAHRRMTVLTKYDSEHWHYQELLRIFEKHKSTLDDENKKCLHFALAKAEEDCGRFEEAAFHLTEGNKLMHQKVSKFFELETWMTRSLDYLEMDRALCKSNIHDQRDPLIGKGLIFIVGMPRSGSTLMENIITMAPNSVDLGESSAFQRAIVILEKIIKENNQIKAQDLDTVANYYLQCINASKTKHSIITDKNLYNWRYAGLIAHCFPAAKIIHSYRNPVDNMLSIYKALFPLGNEYAFNLDSIYKVYQLHDQCMRYYKQRHPNQVILSSYDKLVSDPNTVIPSLIKELEIPWNDMFLRPQDNTRTVRTASSSQVRESIHKKSVQGWKRYSEILQPYADGFKQLGYSIE